MWNADKAFYFFFCTLFALEEDFEDAMMICEDSLSKQDSRE